MGDTWRQSAVIVRIVISAGFTIMMVSAIWSFAKGEWELLPWLVGALLYLAWVFGPLEALRKRMTRRLSGAQTQAVAVLALAGYWIWRFVVDDDASVYLGAGIFVLVIWLIRMVITQGWSRRPD
ncbi:MAG: hypothetical protein HOH95_01245 [Dehalococcoidia bacterium]|nr:hypothetical protein [Dehalococcoidia bacterium]